MEEETGLKSGIELKKRVYRTIILYATLIKLSCLRELVPILAGLVHQEISKVLHERDSVPRVGDVTVHTPFEPGGLFVLMFI